MKIAIISDTHDNLANLERFLGQAKTREITGIIHCGDVATPETLEWLTEKFKGEIKVACGNAEIRREEFFELAKKHKNLEVFAEVGEWAPHQSVQDKEINIAFVHEPDQAEELAKSGKYNFVFHGHTHKPWIKGVVPEDSPLGASQGESSRSTLIANPGTLGGVFMASTFAVLDTITGRLELVRL